MTRSRRRSVSDPDRERSDVFRVVVRCRRVVVGVVGEGRVLDDDVVGPALIRRHAVDLDPDVEDLARLALARPHELEIADEPADRGRGEPLGARLVPHLVLERRDVGDEVRLAARVDGVDGEAPGRRGKQVVSAVRIAPRFADLDERAHTGQRQHLARPRFAPLADEDHAERRAGVETMAGQGPVAVLEDVERHDDARTEDGVQREERDLHRPSLRLRQGAGGRRAVPAESSPVCGHGARCRWSGRGPADRPSRPRVRDGPGHEEAAGRAGGFRSGGWRSGDRPRRSIDQCEQPFGAPSSSAVRKLEPHPQAATAFGLLTVKPAPMSVST